MYIINIQSFISYSREGPGGTGLKLETIYPTPYNTQLRLRKACFGAGGYPASFPYQDCSYLTPWISNLSRLRHFKDLTVAWQGTTTLNLSLWKKNTLFFFPKHLMGQTRDTLLSNQRNREDKICICMGQFGPAQSWNTHGRVQAVPKVILPFWANVLLWEVGSLTWGSQSTLVKFPLPCSSYVEMDL